MRRKSFIFGRGSKWLRYANDVSVIVSERKDVSNKLQRLNGVNINIQFTVELERNNTLIYRDSQCVKFYVYRKPTNKDDFVKLLSNHSDRI